MCFRQGHDQRFDQYAFGLKSVVNYGRVDKANVELPFGYQFYLLGMRRSVRLNSTSG